MVCLQSLPDKTFPLATSCWPSWSRTEVYFTGKSADPGFYLEIELLEVEKTRVKQGKNQVFWDEIFESYQNTGIWKNL